jgi:hypothetical protein
MIKLINKTTGTPMWVADERKDEYLEAGHKLASAPSAKKPVEEAKVEDAEEKPVEPAKEVKVTKKTSKKK